VGELRGAVQEDSKRPFNSGRKGRKKVKKKEEDRKCFAASESMPEVPRKERSGTGGRRQGRKEGGKTQMARVRITIDGLTTVLMYNVAS